MTSPLNKFQLLGAFQQKVGNTDYYLLPKVNPVRWSSTAARPLICNLPAKCTELLNIVVNAMVWYFMHKAWSADIGGEHFYMSDFFFHCSITPEAGPCCFCLEKHRGSIHALGCFTLPVSLLANCGPKSTIPGNSIDQALPRWTSGYEWMSPIRKENMPNVTFSYCVGPLVPPQTHSLFILFSCPYVDASWPWQRESKGLEKAGKLPLQAGGSHWWGWDSPCRSGLARCCGTGVWTCTWRASGTLPSTNWMLWFRAKQCFFWCLSSSRC